MWFAITDLLRSDAPDSRLVAIDPDGRSRNLGDLRRDVAALVADLRNRRAARLILDAEETYWFAAGLLAGLHAGLPLLLAPTTQLSALLRDRGPRDILLTDADILGDAQDIRLGRSTATPSMVDPIDPERAHLVFCTSGSTGDPKRVGKRLVHLEREIATLERTFGAEAGQGPVLSTVANHHIYGILFYVLWPLARGIPVVNRQSAHWGPLLSALAGGILVSSPAHLGRLREIDALPPDGRPRLVFSSGGLLPLDAAIESRRVLGQAPVEVFGSTETGGVAWRRQTAAGVPWRLFPGVAATTSGGGLLQVRSGLFDDSFVEMGDRVEIGTDNTFALLGRTDRIVKIESTRVSLSEIERALCDLPGVREAAAVLLPGRREAIGAVIIATAGAELAAAGRFALLRSVRAALASRLPRVALPRRIRLVHAMPANSQGKRTQADLLTLFEATMAEEPPTHMGDPDILAVRSGDGRYEIDLLVPGGLPCFEGHFPGRPVLPGVTQVDWAWRLGLSHLDLRGRFAGLKGLKFRRVVQPGTRLLLILERRATDRFSFDFRAEDGSVGSGEIQLAPA